ncbi:MAG: HAD superfamily hydrolase (TIGR01509 family) [Limisphaerales bacterium]
MFKFYGEIFVNSDQPDSTNPDWTKPDRTKPDWTNPDWSKIDTVFLDMDGTLLDLHYDNQVWNQALPEAYARHRDIEVNQAREILLSHMREIHGTIEFYSFDYWREYTGLDLVKLHSQHTHLLDYRPGALEFLRWLKASGKKSIIATNAHRHSLAVKETRIKLSDEVASVVSSQDFQAPKESRDYWSAMQALYPFDPERSMFIDDNEPVLDHARDFGIKDLRTIITPDSQRPPRDNLSYPSFDHFHELRGLTP